MPNTKTIGEISEVIILAEFIKAGYPVCLPFGENQRYDMVVEAAGTFLRVQCKTARTIHDDGLVVFNGHSTPLNRTGYRGQADLFAVYCPGTREVYVLPVDEVPETEVYLRLKPTRNNQAVGVRWARDHTLAAWARSRAADPVASRAGSRSAPGAVPSTP